MTNTNDIMLKMTLAEVVRALLKQHGWRQSELERRAGIQHGTLAAFLKKDRGLSYENMRAVAGAFGLEHTDDLYDMALTGNLGKMRQELPLMQYSGRPEEFMRQWAMKAFEDLEKGIPKAVPVYERYLGPRTKPITYILTYPKECIGHRMEGFMVNSHCKDVFPRLWPRDMIVLDYDIKATAQDLVVVDMPSRSNWYCGIYLPLTDDKTGKDIHWVENKSGRHIADPDNIHVVVSLRRDTLNNPGKEWLPVLKDYPDYPALEWGHAKNKDNE